MQVRADAREESGLNRTLSINGEQSSRGSSRASSHGAEGPDRRAEGRQVAASVCAVGTRARRIAGHRRFFAARLRIGARRRHRRRDQCPFQDIEDSPGHRTEYPRANRLSTVAPDAPERLGPLHRPVWPVKRTSQEVGGRNLGPTNRGRYLPHEPRAGNLRPSGRRGYQSAQTTPLNCAQELFAWMLKLCPAGTTKVAVFSETTHVW